MKLLWRISNHCVLTGLGGERADGRWHTAGRGKRIVYLSEHPALAVIEILANLKGTPRLFPAASQLMKVTVADSVSWNTLSPNLLTGNWRETLRQTRSLGDAWLKRKDSALLAVPSVPSPESLNCLFNPLHPDARGLEVEWCKRINHDKRLFHIQAPT